MDYNTRKNIMLEYMKMMIVDEDWHGIRDAAADLERMEAIERATKSEQLQEKLRVHT